MSDEERSCLETASFYQGAVSDAGLLLEGGVRKRTLIGLYRKGLLDRVDSTGFVLHDALRSYFRDGMPVARVQGLVARVVPWLRSAATEAADRGEISPAIGYIGNAIAIDGDPERLSSNLRLLGDYRRFEGDYPGAIEAYRAARSHSDDPRKARLSAEIARCHVAQGDFPEAAREIEAGLELTLSEPSQEVGWLRIMRAAMAFEQQDYDLVLQEAERVGEWLPGLPRDPDLAGTVANLWGLVHWADTTRVDYALARDAFRDAVSAWTTANSKPSLCLAFNNLSLAELELGQIDQAMEHLDRSAEIAEAIGHLPVQAASLFTRARYLTLAFGDYEAAEALYQETYQMAKTAHLGNMKVWHYWHYAELYRYQGRYAEARESLAYFLKASREMLNEESRIDAFGSMCRVCLLAGDNEGAKAYLQEAESVEMEPRSEAASWAIEWAQAAYHVQLGNEEKAVAFFERAVNRPVPDFRGELLLDYGAFLAFLGWTERAEEVLVEAVEELSKIQRPLVPQAEGLLQSLRRGVSRSLSASES